MTDTLTIRAALAELVACKDMQAEIQGLIRQPSDGGKGDKRYAFLDAEYKRRMPLAWEAARLSLTAGSAEPDRREELVLRWLLAEFVHCEDMAHEATDAIHRGWNEKYDSLDAARQHRYASTLTKARAKLAEQSRSASPPATERGYLGSTVDGGIDDHDTEQSEADAFMAQAPEVRQRMWGAATVMPAAPDFETWAKAQAEAEQRRQVGRYVVRAGRVVEWEIDNAADERPDGTYALFAASPSPTSSAPAEPPQPKWASFAEYAAVQGIDPGRSFDEYAEVWKEARL